MNDTKVTKGAVLMTAATIGGMMAIAVVLALLAMAMQPATAEAATVKSPWNVDRSVDRDEVELGQVSVTTHDNTRHDFLYLRDDGDIGFWPAGKGWQRDEDLEEAIAGWYGSVDEVTILIKLDSGEMRMYDWRRGDHGYQRRM